MPSEQPPPPAPVPGEQTPTQSEGPTQPPPTEAQEEEEQAPVAPIQAVSPYLEWSQQPKQPLVGGRDANGQEVMVCRAEYEGLTQPGYTRAGSATCTIGHWGRQVDSASFQVLDTNKPHTWSRTPANRVKAGFAGGSDMFVCRASIGGATYLGKAAADWDVCRYGQGGKEVAGKAGFEFLDMAA